MTSVSNLFTELPAKVIWLPNTPPYGYSNYNSGSSNSYPCFGKVNYVANGSYRFPQGTTYIYDHLSSLFESDGIIYVPIDPSERTCDIIDCIYTDQTSKLNIERTTNYKGILMDVVNIRPYAFYNNPYIKSLTTDIDGVIPEYAFANCCNIPQINISNGITKIEDGAFSGCSSASSLRIAPTVTSIGGYAFSGCSKIGDVTIEDRDTDLTLGSNGKSPMFSDCTLDEVYIGGKIVYNTGYSYGYSPFYRNTSLRKVTITDKETAIYDNEFYGCTGLKEVVIGDGVTSFGKYAFSGCSAIESFEFGAHVETIGEEAFSDCTAMTKMISHNPIPPVCGTEALDDINKWECTLYVPDMAIDTYKAADQWKNFFFVENYIPTGIDSATVTDKEKTEVARYDMGGNRVTESYRGVVIIRYADGTRTKVLNTGR